MTESENRPSREEREREEFDNLNLSKFEHIAFGSSVDVGDTKGINSRTLVDFLQEGGDINQLLVPEYILREEKSLGEVTTARERQRVLPTLSISFLNVSNEEVWDSFFEKRLSFGFELSPVDLETNRVNPELRVSLYDSEGDIYNDEEILKSFVLNEAAENYMDRSVTEDGASMILKLKDDI